MAKLASQEEQLYTLGDFNNWCSRLALARPTTEQHKTGDGPDHAPKWQVLYSETKWMRVTPAFAPIVGLNTKQLKHTLSKALIAMVNRGHWWDYYTRPHFVSPVLWNEPPHECKIFTDLGAALKLNRMVPDDAKEFSFDKEVYAFIDRNMNGRVGFDCERDTTTQRTTLIQMADARVVLLYRPPLHSRVLPEALTQLLRSSSVKKMAVATSQDLTCLKADFDLDCDGMVDLQETALEFGFTEAKTEVLAEYFLRYNMTKEKETAVTYTEVSLTQRLSAAQIKYGAMDAIVAYELGMKLLSIDATNTRANWSRCVYFGEQPTTATTTTITTITTTTTTTTPYSQARPR